MMLYNLTFFVVLIFAICLFILNFFVEEFTGNVLFIVPLCLLVVAASYIQRIRQQIHLLHSSIVHAQKTHVYKIEQHKGHEFDDLVNDINGLLTNVFSAKKTLSITLNAIHDAVFRLNVYGEIEYINSAAQKVFKCSKGEVIGKSYVAIIDDLLNRDIATSQVSQQLNSMLTKPASELNELTLHLQFSGQRFVFRQFWTSIANEQGVISTVVVLRDITQAEKLRDRLRFQANYDPVTRLYNRYKFEQSLADAWHNAKQNNEQHALLQLDMDRFKLINDNAGHAAGDQLLREIGNLLKSNVRQSDICARVGGDEFAVLLTGITEQATIEMLRKLNLAIKNHQFSYGNHIFPTGASLGATLITLQSPALVEVKREADTACFMAKNLGPNNFKLFDRFDIVLSEHQEAPRWAARINNALSEDKFELFYQPIQTLTPSRSDIDHIEILLRLKSEDGLLSPNVFLPAVERFRLSPQVDDWVISKVFEWLGDNESLWGKVKVAINLSADSLTNEELIDTILTKKHQYRFSANTVCFEVTESAAVSNLLKANQMIMKLRAFGFSIALDDFGKGFSTYSYLKNLSADYIKIDGSFVQNMAADKRDLAIVRSIHQVSSSMGMKTIAEFVENDATLAILTELGVDLVQGYAIARPQPLSCYQNISVEQKIAS